MQHRLQWQRSECINAHNFTLSHSGYSLSGYSRVETRGAPHAFPCQAVLGTGKLIDCPLSRRIETGTADRIEGGGGQPKLRVTVRSIPESSTARAIGPEWECGRDRRRSGDLPLFRRSLYQLSYPTRLPVSPRETCAVPTRFELATSALTGRRALQTALRDLEELIVLPPIAPPTGFEPVLPA